MATKRVTHTVEKLEEGQRDSIRRARAKAEGAKPEEYNNLPSESEINANKAEAQAAALEEEEEKDDSSSGSSGGSGRRGPPPGSSEPPQPPSGQKQG